MGRKVTFPITVSDGRTVTRTVEVAPGGEPVRVLTEDGRVITVSAKLAETFPDKYPLAPEPAARSEAG